MKRAQIFLPLAALVAFAAYLGLRFGQVPSETTLINRFVAAYLDAAPAGAKPSDCAARPHPDPTIRLVLTCQPQNGLGRVFFIGPRGRQLPAPAAPGA